MSTVLFVCRQNAGRSQISQALFEKAAPSRHRALSAGTTPAANIHASVVEVMQEIGIDLTDRTPTLLTRELADQADLIITMGCGDQCPVIPGKHYLDWNLPDPADQPIATVRATRNDINIKVHDLIVKLDRPADAALLSLVGARSRP
jgi:arsenate reductase (thioredoxin)